MADETQEIQEQTHTTEEITPQEQGIQFEDILPWGTVGGDTGLTSRLKLKRNFEKIKAWIDVIGSGNSLQGKFLSKEYDDEAAGLIGFLKGFWVKAKGLFGIDGEGNATVNDLTVKGATTLAHVWADIIRSGNFSGYGIGDTGWELTNSVEGSGKSQLTVDIIQARMKIIATALEVRKWYGVGGNFVASPSAGTVWKVAYYDGEGEELGWKTVTVPWRGGGRLLMGIANGVRRLLGRQKRVSRELTAEERQRVRRIRCYLYSDDGTTMTQGNISIGSQMRCQTFNTASMKETADGYIADHLRTSYWWRVVSNIGSEPVAEDDGRIHDYVDFDVQTGPDGQDDPNVADTGSDWPQPGDQMVEFGHRTDTDRQHVITLETVGADAPALKEYQGINSFSLDGKRKTMISPRGGSEIYATKFVIQTEYDEVRVPADRGLWIDIPTDGNGQRRCYYYDRVAHNGSLWLCVIQEYKTVYADADGNEISVEQYDALPVEQQKRYRQKRVKNYTTVEPSEQAVGIWQKEVYTQIPARLVLSRKLVPVDCESDGKASEAVSMEIEARLMVTNLECEGVSLELSASSGNIHLSQDGKRIEVGYAKGDSVTGTDVTVTATGTLLGQQYSASDSLSIYPVRKGEEGESAYEVTCSTDSFILNQQEDEPYEIQTSGAETTIDVRRDGEQQPWRIVSVAYVVDVYNGSATNGYNEILTSWSDAAGVGAKTVGVTYVKNNIKQAHLLITIEYGQGQQRTLRIIIACNLLGSWKQKIIGDAENVWAEKSTYTYTDDEGKEHTITLQEFYANYTRSSSENSAKFREIVSVLNTDGEGTTPDDVTEENYAQYLQSAREAYSQIQKDIYNDDGSIATKLTKFVQTEGFVGFFAKQILNDPEGKATLEGYVQAEADKVSLGIKNGLDSTGIDIENHIIRLNGDTVINGDLLLNSEEQGFLLTGNGGVTRIAPKSIGTYSDVLSKANEYSTFWTSFPVVTDSNGGYSSSFVTIKNIDGISPANVEIVSRGFSCSVYRVSSDVALTGKSIAVSKVGSDSTQIEAQVAWTSSPYPNKEMIVHIYVQVKVTFTMNTLIGYDGISIIMGRDPLKVAYFGSDGAHIRCAGYELVCNADGVGYIDDGSGQNGQYGNVFKFGQKRWRLVYGSLDINDIDDPCDIYIMKQSGFTVTLPTGNYWLNKEITIINGSDGNVYVSGNINGQTRVMPIEDRYEAWVYVNISGEWFGSYRPTGGIGGGGGSDTPVSLQNLNIYNANGGLVLSFNGTAAKNLNLSAAMVGAMASTYAVGRGLVVSGNSIYLTDQNGNMLGSQQTLPSGGSTDTSNCIKNDTTSEQTIKGNLRLKNGNYGNRLLFGDGTYVYFEEDYDDHLKLYSSKGLSLQAPNAQNGALVIEGYSSGSVKRLISFPGKNSNENYIGHVDSGSWGDGMQITTNDLEMNGGYHISMFTPASFGTYTYIVLDAYNGTVSASHAITVGSDRRMKDELENITDMPIDLFADAPLVKFCYKNDTQRTPHIGSYAQYFEDILPETVSETEDPVTKEKHLSLDYTGVTVAGVITAAREIVALKKEVAAKDTMIKNLEQDLADERERRDNIEQRLKRVEELLWEIIENREN